MRITHLLKVVTIGLVSLTGTTSAFAQTTNNIDAPNNAQSTANPSVDLNQNGALVNTQVNNNPLGRSVVGNGIADCTASGLALSVFGSGVGPFDSGSVGGAVTYTQSFGQETCKTYAKTQLAKSKLETCLLIISNYSKISKAGIQISYNELQQLAGVSCPRVVLPASSTPGNVSFTPQPTSFAPASQETAAAQQPTAAPAQQTAAAQQPTAAPAQQTAAAQQRPAIVQQ